MTVRDRLHRLVDALPEAELDTAARVLEALAIAADERPAGERPSGAAGRTDWARFRMMDGAEAEANAARHPDNLSASAEWLAAARVVRPPEKQPVSLRLDADLLAWFRAQGESYPPA